MVCVYIVYWNTPLVGYTIWTLSNMGIMRADGEGYIFMILLGLDVLNLMLGSMKVAVLTWLYRHCFVAQVISPK
jgi:hypothetical protein